MMVEGISETSKAWFELKNFQSKMQIEQMKNEISSLQSKVKELELALEKKLDKVDYNLGKAKGTGLFGDQERQNMFRSSNVTEPTPAGLFGNNQRTGMFGTGNLFGSGNNSAANAEPTPAGLFGNPERKGMFGSGNLFGSNNNSAANVKYEPISTYKSNKEIFDSIERSHAEILELLKKSLNIS